MSDVSVPDMSLIIKPTRRVRSLAPVALGTALVLVTYVTPMATLPRTAAAIGAGSAAQAWMLASMSVGLAAALLGAGVLGDNHGRRRVYVSGLSLVAVGAATCALARDPVQFVAGRLLEGCGGAAIMACGLAVLAHDFPPGHARMRATSVWGASVGCGITAGAVLSAAFDSRWRDSYAVVAIAAALLLLPSWRRIGESLSASRRRLDVPGVALLAAATALLVCALTQGRTGIDVATVALAGAAAIAFGGFAIVESRSSVPLIDFDVLRNRRFRAACIGSLTVGAGITAMASFLPTLVQLGLGSSLWSASLLIIAWSGTSVVTSYLIRHLRRPLTGPLPIAVLLAIVAAGQLMAYGLQLSSSPARLVAPLIISGMATGVLNALLGREAVASVPPDRSAMGSGANNTARYVGAAIGITLFVVVASHGGPNRAAGWNVAVLVSAAISVMGAAAVALVGRPDRSGST